MIDTRTVTTPGGALLCTAATEVLTNWRPTHANGLSFTAECGKLSVTGSWPGSITLTNQVGRDKAGNYLSCEAGEVMTGFQVMSQGTAPVWSHSAGFRVYCATPSITGDPHCASRRTMPLAFNRRPSGTALHHALASQLPPLPARPPRATLPFPAPSHAA